MGGTGGNGYTDPITGRLVWMVYAHRGEHQVIAKAEMQPKAWQKATRLAAVAGESEPAVRTL